MTTTRSTPKRPASSDPHETEPAATFDWVAPGPGSWESDVTHQSAPYGRFTCAVFLDAYASGFADGMAAIGSPLKTVRAEVVNGWMYMRPTPLAGPDEPKGGPPPKFVFEVLFRVHPALRARLRTARTVFEDRGWEGVLERWKTVERPELRRRLDDAAAVDVAALDDGALARHVEVLGELISDSARLHFAHAPWFALVTGNYLVRCEDAGIAAPDAMRALSGASDAVRRPTVLAAAVVDALRSDGGLTALDAPPAELFDAIRAAGPASAAALDLYLGEVGAHVVGETMTDPTVGEQPGWVRTVLARCLEPAGVDVAADAERAASTLAARVPAADRNAWLRALTDAREIAGLRDDDAAPLAESVGRARLAMLEVGRRLVSRGVAATPEAAFELRPDEVGPTLAGHGVSRDQLAEWNAEWARQALVDPPHTLGPASEPPPIDRFPAPIAAVTRAVWAFISRFQADPDEITASGLGVGPGEVTGRAVVVRELPDLDRVEPGDIIVTRTTMTTFNTVLAMSSGVVTETGGAICHAAIMSRELGIPGVVGYPDAMSIPDGATIRIDGSVGTVEIVAGPEGTSSG